MKYFKEFAFRILILVVMVGLAFVAFDMSTPVFQNQDDLTAMEIIECLKQPFTNISDDKASDISELPVQGYSFLLNILLPIIIYIVSIGGFLYLLVEDFKQIKTFSKHNKLARFIWLLWIVVLICLMLLPIAFGVRLFMKSFVLAVLATAIFLLIIAIIYSISSKMNQKRS